MNPGLTRNYTTNGEVYWKTLTAFVSSTAKEICGTRQKQLGLSPWIDEHLDELETHKRRICKLTRKREESNCEATIRQWGEARKSARRQFKRDKKSWEEDW